MDEYVEGSIFQTDAMLQEMVFLGYIYTEPQQFYPYMAALTNTSVFTSPITRYIWDKTVEYCTRYGCMPDDWKVMSTLLDEKYYLPLQEAVSYVLDTDEDKVAFLRDTFINTVKLTLMKSHVAAMNMRLAAGGVDVGKCMESTYEVLNKFSMLDAVGLSSGVFQLAEIAHALQEDTAVTQQPLIPIPIPGIEKYLYGSPAQQINFIVGGYGVGKTTTLCQLAAGMRKHGAGLYVTLEMSRYNIMAKMLACSSDVPVDPNFVFRKYSAWTEDERAGVHTFSHDSDVYPCYIMDYPSSVIRAADIGRAIRYLKMSQGVDIKWMCVDYADLLRTNSGKGIGDDGFSYMIEVMNELQSVCKEYDLVGWTASQVSKTANTQTKEREIFKPLSGKDIWGSDTKLQVGSLGIGLAVYRFPKCMQYGIGCLSVLKDRFNLGSGAKQLVIAVNYACSKIWVKGVVAENILWSDFLQAEEAAVTWAMNQNKLRSYIANEIGKDFVKKVPTRANATGKNKITRPRHKTETMEVM